MEKAVPLGDYLAVLMKMPSKWIDLLFTFGYRNFLPDPRPVPDVVGQKSGSRPHRFTTPEVPCLLFKGFILWSKVGLYHCLKRNNREAYRYDTFLVDWIDIPCKMAYMRVSWTMKGDNYLLFGNNDYNGAFKEKKSLKIKRAEKQSSMIQRPRTVIWNPRKHICPCSRNRQSATSSWEL